MNPQTINESIDKLITEHNLACEALTREQLAKVILEMIQSGDIRRYIHLDSQAVVYVPFRELDRVSEQLLAVTAERNELQERLERHIAVNQEGSERVEKLRSALRFYAENTATGFEAKAALAADLEAVRIGTTVPYHPPINGDPILISELNRARAEVESVTKERDALAADKARLDWLDSDDGFVVICDSGPNSETIQHASLQTIDADLREQIDAAMANRPATPSISSDATWKELHDALEAVTKERDEFKAHLDLLTVASREGARIAEHDMAALKRAETQAVRQRDELLALVEGWKKKAEKWKECSEHLSTQLADELAVFRIGNERRTGSEIRALAERDKAVLERDMWKVALRESGDYKSRYEALLTSLEEIVLRK